MLGRLERLRGDFDAALEAAAGDPSAIEEVRVRFLGRRGELTALVKTLGELPPAERPAAGKAVNEVKVAMQAALDGARSRAEEQGDARRLREDRVDVTLPGVRPWLGSLHPVTRTRRELERIFRDMGYTVDEGPEVEDDFHNFQALNIPQDHPARDDTDTFYVEGELLLRTHTSPVQIRVMEERPPPIRMICAGRVYRRDLDATHLPMFNQLEALVVDEGISMADLKGTMATVWKRFFGENVETRLRPGYFPFVEPGCEYDISRGNEWIELGGAGMVHPAVFEAVGIDPERYTGFAFGLGIDRIAMIRYGVDDLRLLVENDSRFLRQFSI